jgi:pyrroline-5-carboxylate reductase
MDLEMAEILVKQTLIGSAELVSNTNLSLDQLVKTVASKGGTTEAAINHFNSSGFEKIIFEGLQKATQRSKELAKELL